jgi:membrane-associated phospholipid phosphatase
MWFLCGVLVPLAVFFLLAAGLGEDEVAAFDRGALRAVEHLHVAAATSAMRGLTFFGDYLGATLLTVALIAVLVALRRRRDALFVAAVMAGSGVLQYLIKLAFARPRPSAFPPLVTMNSFSFPSGHAMTSASLVLALTVVCWRSRWRWAAIAGGTVFALAVSFTRLYLGVHYPSDLLAGWCLSVAWTVGVWLAFDLAGSPVPSSGSPRGSRGAGS